MSENTIRQALRTMGYANEDMSAHGFRTTASTLLNEQGWSPDAIERQLAHSPKDKVRAAYNRAAYMDERRRMMQSWADYLEKLRVEAEIVPFEKDRSL
jgi:integrase